MSDGVRLNAVVIGRNEGARLVRALAALRACDPGIVIQYVDSGSSDSSVDEALKAGALVHSLDPAIPMNASRARAEGTSALLEAAPETDAVFYLDGDCETEPGFLEAVRDALRKDDKIGVICGWRRERHPEASLYNRLQDLEWRADGSVGLVDACGGDSVMRVDAVRHAGGWDPTVRAGEEPQLCARIRSLGWTVHRLDIPMTVHDAAMTSLGDWIRRERRTGYGVMDVVKRFGAGEHPHFAQIVRSARIWTVGPVAIGILIALAAVFVVPIAVIAGPALTFGIWSLQAARLSLGFMKRGLDPLSSVRAGMLTVASKWWQLMGQSDRLREADRVAPESESGAGSALLEGQRA